LDRSATMKKEHPPKKRPNPATHGESERERFDALLNALLDAAVDAIVVIDSAGRIERFNQAAENIFGYTAAEVAGQNVSMLMPEPYRSAHDSYVASFLATGTPTIIGIGREASGQRRDGSIFPLSLAVGHVEFDGTDRFVGILRDLTSRKQAEELLRLKDEVIRLSFENAPLAAFSRNREGRFVSVNRAMCELLGYTREELLAKNAIEVVHPADRIAAHETAVRLEHRELEHDIHQRRLLRKDGTVVYARLHLGLVHDGEGRPALEIAQIEDLSERQNLRREANDLRERLAHVGRLDTLGAMAAGIAHEINQPLTAIANYAQACRYALKATDTKPDDVLEMLEKITRGAQRAGEVIRGLRSLVRKRESEREELDVNALVTDVVRLGDLDARLRGVRLDLHLGKPPAWVLADGVQIQQVVLNLIHNGLEAMEALDDMQERPLATVTLEVCTELRGGEACIDVCDHGRGLSEQDAENLFHPFYTTKETGLGMGLSICRSIVESHGGRLWFTCNPDRGTTFHVALPAIDAAAP